MKELLTALVKAKQTFAPVEKDKTNPFHKSKYASLDSVLAAVEPALHANGLVLCHTVEDSHLVTRLYHTSGQLLESQLPIPTGLTDPQKLGSIITYYRRYAVCSLLSVTADEDDDGHTAKPNPSQQAQGKIGNYQQALDDKIESHKKAVQECMAELGWDKAKKEEWSKAISPQPTSRWSLQDWERASTKARLALDAQLAA